MAQKHLAVDALRQMPVVLVTPANPHDSAKGAALIEPRLSRSPVRRERSPVVIRGTRATDRQRADAWLPHARGRDSCIPACSTFMGRRRQCRRLPRPSFTRPAGWFGQSPAYRAVSGEGRAHGSRGRLFVDVRQSTRSLPLDRVRTHATLHQNSVACDD